MFGEGGRWEFGREIIALVEDERFESIYHQLDVWHKSIILTRKLNEMEIILYFSLNLLNTIRRFQNETMMRLNGEVQRSCF